MLCDDKSMKECWSKAQIYTVRGSTSHSNTLEVLGNKTKLISLVGSEEKLIIVAIYQDPLEEEMATHSSIPVLGNPMDREAWRATGHRVTKEWDTM